MLLVLRVHWIREKIYVVVGHQAAEVRDAVEKEIGELAAFVTQKEQRGTGDAVMAAKEKLSKCRFDCSGPFR